MNVESIIKDKKCPKCQEQMESGSIKGLFTPISGMIKKAPLLKWVSDKDGTTAKVKVYRCTKCGFLETFGI